MAIVKSFIPQVHSWEGVVRLLKSSVGGKVSPPMSRKRGLLDYKSCFLLSRGASQSREED